MNVELVSVASITVLCYLMAQALKASPLDSKWLPILCGLVGGILGLWGMLVSPAFPAEDCLSAIAVGVVSGLAATGANQVYKQLSSGGEG